MITAFYTAIAAYYFVALSFYVIIARRRQKIALGDGNNDILRARMRAHSNFIEYTPLFLLMLFMVESTKPSLLFIHGTAIAFFLGRFLHAYSLLRAEQYREGKLVTTAKFRVLGMVLSFTAILMLAKILLFAAL